MGKFQQVDYSALDAVDYGPDGTTITAFAKTARTGIQNYLGREVGRDDLPTVRIYRPESEVFSPDTIESFGTIPITVGHPVGGLTSDNFRAEAVGSSTSDIMRDGEYMRVGLKIIAKDAVARVKGGENQLSAGYSHDLDWTSGFTPDGQAYDAKQINIRANHIAIVKAGRAGGARIGDSDPWGSGPVTSEDKESKKMTLRNITVDGFPVETNDAGVAVIHKLQKDLAAKDTDIEKLTKGGMALKKERDDMEGEMKAAKKAAADAELTPAKLSQLVADRKSVEERFKAFTSKDADPLAETADLQRAAVAAYLGDAEAKDMSADSIASVFKHAKLTGNKSPATDPIRATSQDGGFRSSDSGGNYATNDAAIFTAAGVKMKKAV